MSEVVLKIENLSKTYQLGELGTGTISHDLNRWWNKIRGKEDPYTLIGQANDRTQKAKSNFVNVLQDINFEVKQGEILGIIGRNGAGKSTLLKLISRITAPTKGSIKIKGRIASLLEVGTGMHPEMTARENIFLNGAIMGMTKNEITQKFDEIIDFAGCQLYVDTPVKRFSSGMRVRLGFAVAAFLEPEILIVDEVLAVGDAEFQSKAIGKMKEVSSSGGRTVLFVSHNLSSIKLLCTKALLLNQGKVEYIGDVQKTIEKYQALNKQQIGKYISENSSKDFFIQSAELISGKSEFYFNQNIEAKFEIKNFSSYTGNEFLLVRIMDDMETVYSSVQILLTEEKTSYFYQIPSDLLVKGRYLLNAIIYRPAVAQYDNVAECCHFEILNNNMEFAHLEDFNIGKFYTKIKLS